MPKGSNETQIIINDLKPCKDVFFATSRFLSIFNEKYLAHSERLERLCRYLLASIESESPKFSYIGVALNKELSISWIRHIKLLLYKCCVCMELLKPGEYFLFFICAYFHLFICTLIFENQRFFFLSILILYFFFMNERRNTYRKHYIGSIFAYTCFLHITKHMDYIESKKFSSTETWYEPIVQQYIGFACSERILSYITRKKWFPFTL